MPYFFAHYLVFLATLLKKEDTMKPIETYQIPDNYYDIFGIYVSGSDNPCDKVPECPGKFFSDSDRIVTLARESRYKTYFPILKRIDLLSLNYPSLPFDPIKKSEYVKKVIRNNIKKNLTSLSQNGKLCQSCIDYILKCFYLKNIVSISICSQNEDPAAMLACSLLGCSEVIRLVFSNLGNIAVYANPFSSKKPKYEHYHLRRDHSVKTHVIDLLSLLSDALIINALFETLTNSGIPLVMNVYEQCAASIMRNPQNSPDEMKIVEFINSKEAIPYEYLFHFSCDPQKTIAYQGMSSRLSSGLYKLFCEILGIYQDISCENLEREQSRSIATAFITKKNIPKSVLSAMDQTGFLHYFKYVEFDEDTDLNSVSSIEKEFEAMNRTYFSGSSFPDVTIRFRKLGKHKAGGLYYPSLNTLCVDIRSPSSFMHEYFHMIDNQLGDLSLGRNFQEIVEQYKKSFLKELEKESSLVKEKMNGHSKYNISYYFRRAEIFARCGEIYLLRILKAESSLLMPSLGFVYPESETLDSLIQDYFHSLLQEKLANSTFAESC